MRIKVLHAGADQDSRAHHKAKPEHEFDIRFDIAAHVPPYESLGYYNGR